MSEFNLEEFKKDIHEVLKKHKVMLAVGLEFDNTYNGDDNKTAYLRFYHNDKLVLKISQYSSSHFELW